MEASDVVHLRQLEDKNAWLKRIVANLTAGERRDQGFAIKKLRAAQRAKKR